MGKTILSVIAGYLTWTVVFLGGSFGLRQLLTRVEFDAEGFTDNGMVLGLFLATSMLASLLAGYVAGWLADGKHLKHGLILLFCLLATGIPVQMSAWDKLPLWYNLAFLILLTPMTLLGSNFSGGDAPAGKVIR